jgi:hypothetical protein
MMIMWFNERLVTDSRLTDYHLIEAGYNLSVLKKFNTHICLGNFEIY